jgi:GT2 family glycosyltransferase/glycosyltransferase involved in cell wall biosynthesis
MILLRRLLRQGPILLLSPILALVELLALWATDLLWLLFGSRRLDADSPANAASASVVIPNWNGKDLLEKYLPSVIEAMSGHPDNEVIVVDNGSTDGSAAFVRFRFPSVRLIALDHNLGFGGGSNRGFREAKNDIVVLLNSDMRVASDFLAPLLKGFADADVFAVSCQIFFSDPNKLREETGLTQGKWSGGVLELRHRIDEQVTDLYPCFYGGGGSCAFDRRKFLALGGFDEVLRPFYLEDTDLGYGAWKRGWRVLYQPQSHVWHEHRGTIGKKFSQHYINSVVKKNFILFAWKNIHSPQMLLQHFVASHISALMSLLVGDQPGKANFPGLLRAAFQLHEACRARFRARSLAAITDREAFRRPMGGYYRDHFEARDIRSERPRVLFVSPYGLAPATHGGAVFMQLAVRELSKYAEVHLVALLDEEWERQAHEELRPFTASMQFMVRMTGQPQAAFSLRPGAVTEFSNGDLEWMLQRTILNEKIDVVQIEYTNMGQYGCEFRHILSTIFEHDIYFQSIQRQMRSNPSLLFRIPAMVEYLKSIHWELHMLPRFDLIQTCTKVNSKYLVEMSPRLATKVVAGLRAAIRLDGKPNLAPRKGNTLLFVGGFRHVPNLEALQWFFDDVVPILKSRGVEFQVLAIGQDPPPSYAFAHSEGILELAGFRENLSEDLQTASVFLCPILSGSGVRVKLLEAFSYGIPVVSTIIGAEGLAEQDKQYCRLAASAEDYATAIEELLKNRDEASAMARRAYDYVQAEWSAERVIERLAAEYRKRLEAKRLTSSL